MHQAPSPFRKGGQNPPKLIQGSGMGRQRESPPVFFLQLGFDSAPFQLERNARSDTARTQNEGALKLFDHSAGKIRTHTIGSGYRTRWTGASNARMLVSMIVPKQLFDAFREGFEEKIAAFATNQGLLPERDAIRSDRFLSRSVAPHVKKLSQLFNRQEDDASQGLDPYWSQASNRANLRLAYFLCFMPPNLFRVASVWTELARLGYRWPQGKPLRAIEIGAGPATGMCGIAAGERYSPVGLPHEGSWALIEQDQAMLKLGAEWAADYCGEDRDWPTRLFRRRLDFSENLLPQAAPSFNLWLSSFFLNEAMQDPATIAATLVKTWERHLDEDGIAIIVEPALKLQSRRLLAVRKELLALNIPWLKTALPCLGHQECGALEERDDWCHEEVTWWRPPYLAKLDKMCGLDRKTLPFSYLVVFKTKKSLEELLPELAPCPAESRFRLVSPAHSEGRDLEFFLCGQCGKRRARYLPRSEEDAAINRGHILLGTQLRGDPHASRIEKISSLLPKHSGRSDEDSGEENR